MLPGFRRDSLNPGSETNRLNRESSGSVRSPSAAGMAVETEGAALSKTTIVRERSRRFRTDRNMPKRSPLRHVSYLDGAILL